jgi:hypothetical protein
MKTLLFATALLLSGAAQAMAPATDYPPCSRDVTDHCAQHEGRMGHAMHHGGHHHGHHGHHGHHH